MLEYKIPNYKHLKINNVVLDFNGTLACNGQIINGVKERINILSKKCNITVLTADTFGTVKEMFVDTDINIEIIKTGNGLNYKRDYTHLASPSTSTASSNGLNYKRDFIKKLGAADVIAIGNGANDELMLKEAVLGILIIGEEGAATTSLLSSDLVVTNILNALDLLIYPGRLIASLRR